MRAKLGTVTVNHTDEKYIPKLSNGKYSSVEENICEIKQKKQNIRIDNTFDTKNRVGIARNTKIPKIEYEIPSETRVLFSSSVRLSSPLQS